jgi:F-type H+-transporting ATPase subunit epsilon
MAEEQQAIAGATRPDEEQHTVEVEIVTPDGGLYQETGKMVVVPGVEGQMGIMARHQTLVSLLRIGETHVTREDGSIDSFATGIGYVEVLFSKVRVVVDHAEQAGQIDIERAEEARRRAEERLAVRDDPGARAEVDFYRAEQALKRAENRIKVAQRAAGQH